MSTDIKVNDDYEIFRKRLSETLDNKNISRSKLEDMTNIPASSINTYLNRKNPSNPNVIIAAKIAKAIGTSLDYLTGVSEVKKLSVNNMNTPETLLLNLANVVKNTKLTINVNNNVSSLTTSDKHIMLFLQMLNNIINSTKDETDYYIKVDKLIESFSHLVIYRNHLFDKQTATEMVKRDFIYGSFIEEERENYSEVCYEEEQRRLGIWDNGKIKNDFSFLKECEYIDENDYYFLL